MSTARKQYTVKAGSHLLNLGERTCVMGIINMTPDSFSGDGQLKRSNNALRLARNMIRQGADILDVGGESSRPGAKPVSAKVEIKRTVPLIETLVKKTSVPVSIDTYKPEVAEAALEAGASLVNTIKGTQLSTRFLKTVQRFDAAICLMHMKGVPQTMQKHPYYKNVIDDIFQSLQRSVEKCLENGINSDRILIDPGIGFGKTLEHNLEILNRLDAFQKLRLPLLIGVSRKSFIGTVLNKTINDRLFGSIGAACAGVLKGAHVVRVHDVAQTRQALDVIDSILNK